MDKLHTEFTKLELDGLDLDTLEIQGMELVTPENSLESLMLGHGMIEVGASVKLSSAAVSPDVSLSCSCCISCCCG